jgi:hypothetical protein
MLENVFIELYEKGILLFLSVDSYCKNSEDADLEILKDRNKFSEHFDEPIEKGYVFTLNTDFKKLLQEIEEESCAVIKYGFESDSDDKADDVGRNFVEVLNNHGYITEWTESVKDNKTISIVIDENDIPHNSYYDDPPYLLTLTKADDVSPLIQLVDDNIPCEEQCEEDIKERLQVKDTKREHTKGTYKCHVCSKMYKQKKSFEKHMSVCVAT